MTTAQELIDAVRPCLPLPGLFDIGHPSHDGLFIVREKPANDEPVKAHHWRSYSDGEAEQLVIGALWQECARRGWICGLDDGKVNVCDPLRGGVCSWSFTSTDAISFCRAFAAAKGAKNA